MNRYEYLSSVCVPLPASGDHSGPIPNCLLVVKELIKKSGLVVSPGRSAVGEYQASITNEKAPGQVKLSGRRSLASCWMLKESMPRTGVVALPNIQPPGDTTVWKFFKQTLK